MQRIFSAFDTFQPSSGRLKLRADANMDSMFLTFETSQPSRGWSNAEASLNIRDISPTFDTSQHSMGWLKYFAMQNMPFIVVTFEVSHVSRPSKFLRFDLRNSSVMSVIRDVSISPRRTSFSRSSFSSFVQAGLYFLPIFPSPLSSCRAPRFRATARSAASRRNVSGHNLSSSPRRCVSSRNGIRSSRRRSPRRRARVCFS